MGFWGPKVVIYTAGPLPSLVEIFLLARIVVALALATEVSQCLRNSWKSDLVFNRILKGPGW